ncbi:hypothetical protein OG579_03425 [Williamsia herbipolensis]|uniref:Nucleoside phosphorylase domain-containing protein n=1 Tax=Williamsia herbipolensis TaxID=1603258 RepID=A0AAU4K4H5_9NOCA|nr:hypothetical protein [Williamsia herbipolensis]
MNSFDDQHSHIRALLHALDGMAAGPARTMVLEQFLHEICVSNPFASTLIASVLKAIYPNDVTLIAEALATRVPQQGSHATIMTEKQVDVDILLLTVKENEFLACLSAFGVAVGVPSVTLAHDCEVWRAEHSGVSYAIAIIGDDGNVESAIAMGKLWSFVQFKAAIMVGMAAGVRGKTKLGDVVFGSTILAYEFQRMTETGPKYQPKVYSPAGRLLQRLPTLTQVSPDWSKNTTYDLLEAVGFEGIADSEEEQLDPEWRTKIHTGAILAGGKLIEDGSLPQMRDDLHARVLAAEMEGAGFAAVCDNERVPWVVVRGVADYGEPQRRKSWQFPATFIACRLVRDAIPLGRLPVIDTSHL